MDKNKSVVEIRQLVEKKQYVEALEVLERMDMQTELTEGDLAVFVDVYIWNKQFKKAKTLLEVMFKSNASQKVISQLIFVSMSMNDMNEAEKYYTEYNLLAPNDDSKYVIRYRLDKAQNKNAYALIDTLEKIAENEFVEEFAYDLAKLYFETKNGEQCLKKCNEIIVLGTSKNVIKKVNELKDRCLIELLNDSEDEEISSGTDIWKQFQQKHNSNIVNDSIDVINPYKKSFENKATSIKKGKSLDDIEAKARLSIELNARKALEEKFRDIENRKKEAEDKLQSEIIIRKKIESRLEKSEGTIRQLEERIRTEDKEKKVLHDRLEMLQLEKGEYSNNLKFLNTQKETIEKKYRTLDNYAKGQTEKLSKEVARSSELQKEIAILRQKSEDLENKVQIDERTKSQLLSQIDTKDKMLGSFEKKVEELNYEIDRLNVGLKQRQEKVEDITDKLEAEKNNVKILDEKLNSLLNEKNEIEGRVRQIEQDKRIIETNLKECEYSKKILENKCSQNVEHKRYLENRLEKLEEDINELGQQNTEFENKNIILADSLRHEEEKYKELQRENERAISELRSKNETEINVLEDKLKEATERLENKTKEFENDKLLLEERIGKSVANNKMLDQNLKSKIDIINSLDVRIKAVMNEKKILTEQKKQLEEKLLRQINNNKQLDEIIKKHIDGKKFLEEQLSKGHDHIDKLKEKNNQGLEIIKRLEDKIKDEEDKYIKLEEKLRASQMKCDSLDKELRHKDKLMQEARDKEINLAVESGAELLGLTENMDNFIESKLEDMVESAPKKTAYTNSSTNKLESKKDEIDSIYESLSESISKFLDDGIGNEAKQEEEEKENESLDIPKADIMSFATPDPMIVKPSNNTQVGSFFESPDVPDYKKAYDTDQSLVSKLFGGSELEVSQGEYNYEASMDERQMYYQDVMQSQMLGNYGPNGKMPPITGQYVKEIMSPEIFGYFYSSPYIIDQIQRSIFSLKNDAINNNFVIIGSQCYNKNELSRMIARQLFEKNIVATNKIARISGDAFNRVDLDAKAEKLVDGCVIIQNAEMITNIAFSKLIKLISSYEGRIFVILETDKNEHELFNNSQNARQFFGSVIKLPVYSVDFLMEYSKTFLVDNSMGISEEAESTLANVFNNRLQRNANFPLTDVVDYLNSCMETARKRKKGKSKHPTDIVIRQDINVNW